MPNKADLVFCYFAKGRKRGRSQVAIITVHVNGREKKYLEEERRNIHINGSEMEKEDEKLQERKRES